MEKLIKLIAAKDERAPAERHRVIHHRIVPLAMQCLDEETLAKEVVLEARFEVSKHAPRFAAISPASTWIRGIARRQDCPTNTVKTRIFHAQSNLRVFVQTPRHGSCP